MTAVYQIDLTRRAARDLRKIQRGDPKLYGQIIHAIQALSTDPHPDGHVDLGGREGYRIRVRDHRISYSVEEHRLIVDVARVGPRGDVHK